ncbi:YopX family protein [Bacillus velezensis]|uniref:YopX family protein n=1 Tax=Bacillus velezensis TaxID=492670 RepID=UPI0015F07FB2|nr:YopX family protein [Bacillus velezensis]QMI88316.1 hypothetical protein H1Q60_19750 [Bacillus velezensis]
MRDIKLRAWDDVKDRMLYLGEEDDIVFGFGGSGIVATDITEDEPNFKTLHHLIYLQYTGLKDKNGQEIYEGDIVRNHRDNSNELLEVLWKEEVAEHASDGIYWTKEVPGFRFKRIKRGLTTVFVAHVDLEVIGNIYENPELLEAAE